MKFNFIPIFFVLLFSFELDAQVNLLNAQDPADIGKRDQMQVKQDEDKKLEYGYVDERDIMFSKVIWEVIDLNQRVNYPYLYPTDTTVIGKERRPLIHYLLKGIESGDISLIYSDGKFNNKITYGDLEENNAFSYTYINNKGTNYLIDNGGRSAIIEDNNLSLGAEFDNIYQRFTDDYGDPFSNNTEWYLWMESAVAREIMDKDVALEPYENAQEKSIVNWLQEEFGDKYISTDRFEYGMVDHYKIKGVWYFDKRIAELKYRPLAIAPVARQVVNMKDDRDISDPSLKSNPTEMFWVYYPDARDVLKDSYVFSDSNSAIRKSFDELINARRFHTMIYLEENMYEDREIGQYISENAFMRLLESERIKEKIRNFEHDMWSW